MIAFKKLTLRNFLSYGNQHTEIALDFTKPTLISGKNYDSSVNGQIDSNGAGKSAILNAIAFCLYDKTISNIDKSDVVNYVNKKDMEISIMFIKDNVYYKVERYRKNKDRGGDGVRLYVNESDANFTKDHDKTPDSVANANAEIEHILGIPFDIFARIVVFTASYEPFLNLPASHTSKTNQRDIIEELFGLTELTRKAEKLKLLITETKQSLKVAIENNCRIENERSRYETQLEATKQKLRDWDENKKIQEVELSKSLKMLTSIDTDSVEQALTTIDILSKDRSKLIADIRLARLNVDNAISNNKRIPEWETEREKKINKLQSKLEELSAINVSYFKEIQQQISELKLQANNNLSQMTTIKNDIKKLKSNRDETAAEIEHLSNSKCPYCKQHYNEAKLKLAACVERIATIKTELTEQEAAYDAVAETCSQIEQELTPLLEIKIPSNLKSIEQDLLLISNEIKNTKEAVNPFIEIDMMPLEKLANELNVSYTTIDDALNEEKNKLLSIPLPNSSCDEWSRNTLNKIISGMETAKDRLSRLVDSKNPFTDVINEINHTLEHEIEHISDNLVDELNIELEHQEFLLKLLTKKDSFVRKALLNKNIPFLNSRLSHYLEYIGLNHKVLFTEDMTVRITQFGTEYGFANLSAGQKARINLALSFAFRDVLQARFEKINFCILDECLDVGLGNVGVQLAAKMIKNIATTDGCSMFVISHRDEIMSMFDSKLEIELRNGFSEIKS